MKQFSSELDQVLSSITKGNTNVIIIADFNIDLLQLNDRVEIKKYFDLFVTLGLFPKIRLPTRPAIYNASLIDQLFCKDPRQHVSYIIKSNMSDHYPYFSILDILKHSKNKSKYVKISNMNENSFSLFCSEIANRLVKTSWDNELYSDPNENYNKFEWTLLDAKSNFLAPKTV